MTSVNSSAFEAVTRDTPCHKVRRVGIGSTFFINICVVQVRSSEGIEFQVINSPEQMQVEGLEFEYITYIPLLLKCGQVRKVRFL